MFIDEKAVGESQEVQQRITKLSQAIREGCKTTRQVAMVYIDHRGGACAIGAAMIAMGIDPTGLRSFSQLRKILGFPNGLHGPIADRNDNMGWTREQIADWLEAQGY
jgi:hypothetical protein